MDGSSRDKKVALIAEIRNRRKQLSNPSLFSGLTSTLRHSTCAHERFAALRGGKIDPFAGNRL
jgi:hypothetical protein